MPQPVRIQQAAKRYRAVATPSWLGLHGSAFQEREERGVELQDLRRVVGGARGGRACRCGGGPWGAWRRGGRRPRGRRGRGGGWSTPPAPARRGRTAAHRSPGALR